MIRRWFDDSRLEADDLAGHESLWWLASAGARIRRAALSEPAGRLTRADRPRGVLVLGAEARLVRAVLEPACPVPFMAWPGPALPAWVGPLDLVVALGSHDAPVWEVRCIAEAVRRGATVIAAAPDESALAAASAGPLTTHLPTPPDDPMAAAIAVLALLGQLELRPAVDVERPLYPMIRNAVSSLQPSTACVSSMSIASTAKPSTARNSNIKNNGLPH